MKKLIISTLSIFMLGSISFAQTTSGAYQIANRELSGTARFNGLSGAFGALGGDLSSVSENPAGSAVFNHTSGSVTLAQGGSGYTTNYFGTETETEDAGFYFNQIGGVLVLKENNPNTHVNKIALAFNYNKTNNFDSEYVIQGNPNNTIGDFFVGQANGKINGDLLILDGETLTDAYIAIGNTPEYGAIGQQAFLGLESTLISPTDESDLDGVSYISNSDGSETSQFTEVRTSGTGGKYTFNLAAAYESGLHMGVNFNLHTFNKFKETRFSESNNYASVGYSVDQRDFGAGLSADFGFIYKTQDNFRFGAVYQTPTYYSVITEVDQFISLDFNDNTFIDVDPAVVYEYDIYSLRTPGKLAASAAYVFGGKGLLSFEYSSQDFANMEYGAEFSGANEINNIIKDTYKRVETYRLGAEIRNVNWTFRGGLSRSTRPYQDPDFGGDTKGYSLGLGHDWGQWKLDFAYNHLDVSTAETTFENNEYLNTANIEEKRDRVTVTLGVNF